MKSWRGSSLNDWSMHRALLAAGAASTLALIEGADHCFWGVEDNGICERDIAFLRATFGG